MVKVTVVAPANIAFIKYWGRSEHNLYIARNTSISMTMSGCITTTTVEVGDFENDQIEVKFFNQEYKKLQALDHKPKALFKQIERIRSLAKSTQKTKIKTENNFPNDVGIASSASGFAALTGALLLGYGLEKEFADKEEFSRQIRLCGSGSAIRSAMGGFVEFLAPKEAIQAAGGFSPEDLASELKEHLHKESYARQITDENHWNLVDIVAITNPKKKLVSSSQGHLMADTSPYYETRISEMQDRIAQTRQAILDKDIRQLGPLIEEDSNSMHSVMMTSKPPIFYWSPGSMEIMLNVMKWRREDDLQAYFTLDAGSNVHVITEKKDSEEVKKRLENLPSVQWTIYNQPCPGVTKINKHLF